MEATISDTYKKARLIAISNPEAYKDSPIFIILKQRQKYSMAYIEGKMSENLYLEFLELQDNIIKKEFTI